MQQLINSARFWGLMLSLLFSLHSMAHELPDPERVGRQIAERLAERQRDNVLRVSLGEKADYIVDILPEYIADGDRIISIDRIAEDRQKLKEIWNIEATGLLSQLDNLKDGEGKTVNCYIVRAGIFNYLNKDDLSVRNWENITPGRAKSSKSGNSIKQNYQSFLNHVDAELDRRNPNWDRDAFYQLLFTVFEIDESTGKTKLYHFIAYKGGRFSDRLKPLKERSAELAHNTPNLGSNSHINTFSTYFKEALELITGNSYLSNEQYVARLEQQANGSTAVRISLKGTGKGTETDKKELEDQLSQLATEKYNALGETGRTKLVNESQGNMGEFYVKDMNRKEWVGAIGHLGASVWENAALPEDYWNEEQGSKTSAIRMPATFVGVSDGVIDEVTSYPQLAKLGYEVASKPEVRNALWESVKGISVETIKDAAIDFYEQKKANYTSDKPYIVQHTVSKDAVQLASIFIGGGGLKNAVKNVDEGVDDVGKKVKKAIDSKKINLDDFMKSKDFTNLMDNSFKKYKGQLSRAEWETRYKTLYKNREVGKLTEEQFLLLEGGFKPKKAITTSDGRRYFDNVMDETAREVKSGPISLSNSKQQILKDIEILNEDLAKGIDKIEWHCFNVVNQIEIEKFIYENLKPELRSKMLFKIISY
ncbi:hypothetical protein [Sphingobacterium luzhongxinii]|uniref:hypothetical protein n=1 Tax=Sphingobacterium luzhongxinii TaxID=2654181 RepID=UPI0013DD6F5F|nr:hypothetical protein [Sphingobacterium sp. xlx-73]